jgi:gamma-glutamyltranspeptidase / glutathione hydrolase
MVTSANPLATQAGVQLLRRGGNAVDAAVGTAFAISVVEQFSAGIGGGGFLLVRDAKTGKIEALDFRERAPQAASRNMFLDAQGRPQTQFSQNGHRAVAVPGTIAGLRAVHDRYGKLPWSQVVAPAIALAQDGFPVSNDFVQSLNNRKDQILTNPAARSVLIPQGQFLQYGETLKQPDLANTLRRIAQSPQDFYQGQTARAIATDMQANGGLITLQDLANYKVRWLPPLCAPFRQYKVCSMPPPSSGGVHLIELLNLVGDRDLTTSGWHHPSTLHFLAEAMKIVYADRAVHLGDPAFVKVPVSALINPAYAAQRRQEIDLTRARTTAEVKAADADTLQRYGHESDQTTHLNVVDRDRNAVALTFTVNGRFGAGVVAAGTGILLNNEMDDFAIAPSTPNLFGLVGSDANAIAPGKTPLSSMSPTLVLDSARTNPPTVPPANSKSSHPQLNSREEPREGPHEELRLAVGSPGGGTIITTVFQIILNRLIYKLDISSAVAAPRLHHQWQPETLRLEQNGFDVLTTQALESLGHKLSLQGGWGNASAISVDPQDSLTGAADPRGEGSAQGY